MILEQITVTQNVKSKMATKQSSNKDDWPDKGRYSDWMIPYVNHCAIFHSSFTMAILYVHLVSTMRPKSKMATT